MAVHGTQTPQPLAVVFDDLAGPALDPMAAQHLQDHVLGRDPGRKLAGEFDAHDLRCRDIERIAGHGHGDFEPADADGEHPQGTGGAGMGVGADESGTRFAEP